MPTLRRAPRGSSRCVYFSTQSDSKISTGRSSRSTACSTPLVGSASVHGRVGTCGQRAATCGRRSTVHGMSYSDAIRASITSSCRLADHGDDRIAHAVRRHEDLQQPFFGQLEHRLVEPLVTASRRAAASRSAPAGTAGCAGNSTRRPAYSVSPIAMRPGFTMPTTSPGIRLGHGLPIAAEEAVDARQAQLGAQAARSSTSMSFAQPARADAHERHAVAVARVHVRLDLEHEPRASRDRSARPARRRSCRGPGGGASVSSACRNGSHAEVVQRAAEEDRRLPGPRGTPSGSKRVPAPVMISTASISSCCRSAPTSSVDLRVVGAGDGHRRRPPSPLLPLVEEHRVGLEVVDAAEVLAVAERPVHRRRRDARARARSGRAARTDPAPADRAC